MGFMSSQIEMIVQRPQIPDAESNELDYL